MLQDEKERSNLLPATYKDWREIEVEKDYSGLRLEEKE